MFRHRRRGEVPSLNTSSTADISFMLLIFFLVTSSMDAGKGLNRQMPPPPQDQEQVADILESDIMTVVLDADNRLTLNGDTVSLQQLQREVREFAAVNPKHRVVAAYKPLNCPPRVSEVMMEGGEAVSDEGKGGQP